MMTAVPTLVSIDDVQLAMSPQGQPMAPLVSADRDGMDTALLSGGVVSMRPRHAAQAHCHRETDVAVLLWKSGVFGALTLYGDRLEHEIWQQPQEVLWIPRGVPHAAINPSSMTPIVAFEFRSNPVLGEDNHPIEDLEPIVDARRQAFSERGFRRRERLLSYVPRRWGPRRSARTRMTPVAPNLHRPSRLCR